MYIWSEASIVYDKDQESWHKKKQSPLEIRKVLLFEKPRL